MERTKLVVELRFETSYYTWRRHPGVDWETQKLLGLGSRCIYLRDCTTCRRKFLGAPTACYCSEECRHPAKLAAAARQQARYAANRKRYWAREGRCSACGAPMPERKRQRDTVLNNFCSNACRQKAYRRRKQAG
jgi:hypothetical protein